MGSFTAPALFQKLKPGKKSLWDLLKQSLTKNRVQEELSEILGKEVLVIDQRSDLLHKYLRKIDLIVWLDFTPTDRKHILGLFDFLSQEPDAPLCLRIKTREALHLLLETVRKREQLPQKVLAYVLRPDNGNQALLVSQKEREQNLEIIRGRVDQGETPEQSLLREIQEESGLQLEHPQRFYFESLIANDKGETEFQLHHCYFLRAHEDTPKEWTHVGTGHGPDRGTSFHYSWIPMSKAGSVLNKEMREPLSRLRPYLRQSRETMSLAPRLNVK